MSKEITKENARTIFLENVRVIARYWATTRDGGDVANRCDGVAFSILSLIDGCSSMPSMDIVLRPHPDDMEFCKSEGMDWYVDGMAINDNCLLHEFFHQEED